MLPITIDIIILSYAKNQKLQETTINCIKSLVNSENAAIIKFNIIIFESNSLLKNYQYPFSQTIYPQEPFNFHQYMNMGIETSSNKYVCLCNNDLVFHANWASEILKCMEMHPDLMSASPLCTILQPYISIALNSGIKFGYRVGYELAGWCLFFKREMLLSTGKLDENYIFSSADYDYSNTLAVLNIKHALITSAWVDHLNSVTINTMSAAIQSTFNDTNYYNLKWNHRILPF